MSIVSHLKRAARRFSGPAVDVVTGTAPLLQAEGMCPVCQQATTFKAYNAWLRDSFVCGACGCLPRERALIHVLGLVRPGWRGDAIHESSPSSRGSRRLQADCPGYVATHFFPGLAPGALDPTTGYRNENLERQTFADDSFDVVVTQDVFEHLLNPDRAAAEIARTLRPGGLHVFTVPLVHAAQPSERRAREVEGAVVHLKPPEFHGNPIDDSGSLVTVDWGFDLCDFIQRHAGMTSTIYSIDDLTLGIRAELNHVIVSRKSGVPDV